MVEIFKYVDKFFISLTNYLTYNDIFIIFVGLSLFTIFCVLILTSRSYEAKLIKAIDKLNVYFIDNPQINEENLVAFNNRMKAKNVPKQLRKHWQQFVLYREDKASGYMSFENCVSNPIKNSSYKRDMKVMGTLNWIFSLCSLILNAYYCFETNDIAAAVRSMILTPVVILLLNYIFHIFLNLRHSAIVSDLFQNYQYFEVNIDKATETLPEYVDYEVLFDRNEIKKGIPILYAYLQKRAEEEQRELERARLRNVEHEKFNFDDQGVAASLVLERAMQEAENYIAERKKYNQDTQQINDDITQEDMNYREITKEYNRQMQVSKETFANFKSQLEEVSSTIEANYLKKQQQQELDRQRNLERDFDTATERHKKVIESYQSELDTVDEFIAQSRKNLEEAMKSEFSSYSSKVYDEVKKVVEEREKEKFTKLKQNIEELEEQLVAKNQELEQVYTKNQSMTEQIDQLNTTVDELSKKGKKNKNKFADDDQPFEIKPEFVPAPILEVKEEQSEESIQEQKANDVIDDDSEKDENFNTLSEYQPLTYNNAEKEYQPLTYEDREEETEYQPLSYDENESVEEELEPLDNEDFVEDEVEEETEYQPLEYQPLTYEDEDAETEYQPLQYSPLTYEDEENDEENLNEELDEISTEETDVSIETKPASRRGRPRKVVDAKEQGEKRGRGRPRKVVQETISSEPKRKAGRPRKEKSDVEQKKGRGRPKKIAEEKVSSVVKKKAGRPRKEKSDVVEQKKGRGRPRKTEETKVSAIKKGRGRPRKLAQETISSEPKRKAGRPRKEKPEVVEQKKGRGRPRKTEETKVSAIKKGRGRPKKVNQNGKEAGNKEKSLNDIKDIDAYLREIDDAIAAENAKLEETQKELAKKAKIRNKK